MSLLPVADAEAALALVRDTGSDPAVFIEAMETLGRRAAEDLVVELEPCVHAVHLAGCVEDHDGFVEGLRKGLDAAGFAVSVGTYWPRPKRSGESSTPAGVEMVLRHVTAEPEKPFALVLAASVAGTQEKVVAMADDALEFGPKSAHVVSAISHAGFADLVRRSLPRSDAVPMEFATIATDPEVDGDGHPSPGVGGPVAARIGLGEEGPVFVPESVRKAVETAPESSPAARLTTHDGRAIP